MVMLLVKAFEDVVWGVRLWKDLHDVAILTDLKTLEWRRLISDSHLLHVTLSL